MSRLILPSIAVTAVAIFLISRKRKVEFELEIEPRDDMKSDAGDAVMATQVLAE